MNVFTRFSLKNAVAVFIISFLLLLAGLYSFSSLKVDLLPDIEFPSISVEAVYPGASAGDVNDQITEKLEEKFSGINGLKSMTSSSFDSVAVINLEFPFNTDMEEVEGQVNALISETDLPEIVQTRVNRFSFGSYPIYNISLFAKGDNDVETLVEKDIIPELNKIEGINSVSVGGLMDEYLEIIIDKEKAASYGFSLMDIKQEIENKTLSFPAGSITDGDERLPVRVQEGFQSVEDVGNLLLISKTNPQAPPVLLKDVANIQVVSERGEYTRYNLKEALSLAITKKQGANTVEVADQVLEVLNHYDDKIDYAIGFDSAEGIKKSVEALVREGLLGALFASISVFLFLRNIRATIIAIISIPLSLVVSSIFLAQMDISLNVMTLGGMAVAVGRVVDDSIVVIENIFRRARKAKERISDPLIEDSTKEIVKAITSSTITTIVVFLPLGFVEGITGEFFLPFALTIVFSLLISLLVSVTIVPILAKFSFRTVPDEKREGALQQIYGKTIQKALDHKVYVLVISLLLLFGSFAFVPKLGFTFIPNEEQKTLVAAVELPSSVTLEKTNEVSLQLEEMFLDNEEIEEVTAGVGSRDFRTGLKRSNQANYFITLKDGAEPGEVIEELEKSMEKIVSAEAPDSIIGVQELSSGGPPTNNNVDINLYSSNLDSLQLASKRVEEFMEKQKNLKYVTNNFSDQQKQIVVRVDSEKASELGVSGFQLLGIISDQTEPTAVNNVSIGEEERNIRISYDEEVPSKEKLENLTIFTNRGPMNLTEIAKVEVVEAFTSIQKLDGKVYAKVSAQIDSNNIQSVTKETIEGVESEVDLPPDVSFVGGGGSDETAETFRQLGLAMAFAIGLVYITMLITFGKARIPFIILSSLIFVPIGSLFGLVLMNEPLSVSIMIGFLMLIGIVTTNAIVLVDRIGQNRNTKKMPLREAIIEAGKTRLRPILMTAFATVAALIPLALTTSEGTLISKGLAITVIGGLTSSTFLTLVIVPVVYELFFNRQGKKEIPTKSIGS